tara:strand:- start:3718 stop:4647 length:930 start_codon:yes stop_codon:yes gene_type:complete
MEVIVEEKPDVKEDTIEISMHDWIVSDEEFKKSFEEWKKENTKIGQNQQNYFKVSETGMKNSKGYESNKIERLKIVNKEYTKACEEMQLPYFHELEKKDMYVRVYENVLSDSFCDHIIKKFEENPDFHALYPTTSYETRIIIEGGVEKLKGHVGAKYTTEMYFNENKEELKYEDTYVSQQLNRYLTKYFNELDLSGDAEGLIGNSDSGYQMQKYTKNEGRYIFHNDFSVQFRKRHERNQIGHRTLTFIFYLNDVEEGGETTFPEFKVKPKKGSLLLFPATWNYVHSGNIPKSDDKYIITGWMWKYTDIM